MASGIVYALTAAILFGVSTPLAKVLLGTVPPLVLAGLLYAGSGVGLLLLLIVSRGLNPHKSTIALPRHREWLWLGGAILSGGVIAPVALLYGLVASSASSASLMLNLEAVFTAVLAWFLFKENFDRRIALGMLLIVAGGFVLTWSPQGIGAVQSGSLLIAAACLCWALDNNLTRRVSAADPALLAALKGLVAALVNLGLAVSLGYDLPNLATLAGAAVIGFIGYGISLMLFVLALRHLGSARTGAYFSVAPFFGALVALLLPGEVITTQLVGAGLLMATGVWLHLTERHEHLHTHEYGEHAHAHWHDEHHRHAHADDWDGREPHTHSHEHLPLVHSHPHYPDLHHRHPH